MRINASDKRFTYNCNIQIFGFWCPFSLSQFIKLRSSNCKPSIYLNTVFKMATLKVSKSQKQNTKFSLHPKKERNTCLILPYRSLVFCVWDLLTLIGWYCFNTCWDLTRSSFAQVCNTSCSDFKSLTNYNSRVSIEQKWHVEKIFSSYLI